VWGRGEALVDPSLPMSARREASEQFLFQAVQMLERRKPGAHWVGARVEALSEKGPQRGSVRSFDPFKVRFVLELEGGEQWLASLGRKVQVDVAKAQAGHWVGKCVVDLSQDAVEVDVTFSLLAPKAVEASEAEASRWDSVRLDRFAASAPVSGQGVIYMTAAARG